MAETKAQRFARQYGSQERVEWIRAMRCAACGNTPCDNHHDRGKHGPDAYKQIIPLCKQKVIGGCHHLYHTRGHDTFLASLDGGLMLSMNGTWVAFDNYEDCAAAVQQLWETHAETL